MIAHGRFRSDGMNKLEAAYAQQLEWRKRAGELLWYAYEGIKFKLAPATFYTPDFAVMMADGELQIHEVKGFWEEDARVKIKIAAQLFPIRFIAIRKSSKEGWVTEEFT